MAVDGSVLVLYYTVYRFYEVLGVIWGLSKPGFAFFCSNDFLFRSFFRAFRELFFCIFSWVLQQIEAVVDSYYSLGLQIPSQKVLWSVFRSLSTFLEGIWSPRDWLYR